MKRAGKERTKDHRRRGHSLSRRRRVRRVLARKRKWRTKKKKKISSKKGISLSGTGRSGQFLNLVSPSFSLFFLSFSLFLRHNKRALSSTLRAHHHHHLREKKRAHTQQQQSTTTQTKDRKKCERSSSAEFKNQFV